MIRTINLTKKYNNFTAVKELNLNVKKGETYGFLGPNGAGKTTTILMILGIVKPTKGIVKLFGKNLKDAYFDIKRRIGVASEEKNLYYDMSAWDYLAFFAEVYNVENKSKRVEEVLKVLNLYDRKDEKLKGYSKGMRQKIEIARALISDPEILILDEPDSGLDPYGIKEIRNVILSEKDKGKTIIISSHTLSEIERVCDRIGIINLGVLVAEDSMADIKKRLSDSMEIEIELNKSTGKKDNIISQLSSCNYVKRITLKENVIKIKTDMKEDYRNQISQIVSANGVFIVGMKTNEMTFEDAFITITEGNISMLTEKDYDVETIKE